MNIKYKFLLLVLILFLAFSCTKSEKIEIGNKQNRKIVNEAKSKELNSNELRFQTIRGENFNLKNWDYRIILVLSYPDTQCSQCFKELNQIIKQLNEKLPNTVKSALVFPYYKEDKVMLMTYSKMIRDLLKQDTTFFDIKLENSKEAFQGTNYFLFNRLDITLSPAVLLINGDKLLYLSNIELYENNNYEKSYKIFEEFFW